MEIKFSGQISEDNEISNFMEIRLVGAELFHADGRTGRHYEANSLFSQFLKTPKRYVQSGTRADGKLTGTETLV
jgi:hypothetical protein